MKKIIFTDKAPAPIGPYNQAVQVNDTLYVSGNIAVDAVSGNLILDSIENETEMVMRNLGFVLEAAGMNYGDIVKTSIFISDMNDFSKINDVYAKYFENEYPARETVEVSCLPKNVNVEISCIASK